MPGGGDTAVRGKQRIEVTAKEWERRSESAGPDEPDDDTWLLEGWIRFRLSLQEQRLRRLRRVRASSVQHRTNSRWGPSLPPEVQAPESRPCRSRLHRGRVHSRVGTAGQGDRPSTPESAPAVAARTAHSARARQTSWNSRS